MLKPDIEDPFYSFPGRRGPAPELSPQQTIYARRGDAAFADGGEADAAGEGEEDPTKDDQRDDHPFAISAQVTELGLSGEAVKVRVKVLGGTYATGDGDPFTVTGGDYPAVVLDETQDRESYEGVVALFVPLELCAEDDQGAVKLSDGRYAKAKTGGGVTTLKYLPAAFPVAIRTVSGPGCYVHLGTWTSRYAEQDTGGVPTRENRLNIHQLVLDDVVLTSDSAGEPATGTHPFQVRLSDSSPSAPKARISASSRLYTALASTTTAISGIGDEIALGSSTKVWLKGTVNSSLVVTAASITTTDPAGLITTTGSPATQTEFHLLIGKVTSGASGAPGFDFKIGTSDYHFEQTCFTHLLVEARCNNGVPVVYPFSFTGA